MALWRNRSGISGVSRLLFSPTDSRRSSRATASPGPPRSLSLSLVLEAQNQTLTHASRATLCKFLVRSQMA